MSERYKAEENVNDSKNTRLPIREDFANGRFNRDAMAHVTRYLYICECLMELSKKLGRPIRILDIGCGDIYIMRTFNGSFVARKTDYVESYIGLDLDEKSLARTEKTMPHTPPIKLIKGDITNGALKQFKPDFDLITCTEVIEHIKPDLVKPLLLEIKPLAPYHIFSTPNFSAGTGKLPKDHIKEWDYIELRNLIEECGYLVYKTFGVFSNLNLAKKVAKADAFKTKVFDILSESFDSNMVSICMARFLEPENSQNVLYQLGNW